MKPADVLIAVLVAIIWGFGFIASRLALNEFSPELMTALRFSIAALPCLFVRKPAVSWPVLIAISFSLFLGQFLTQAYAIAHGMPVGLSSVIVQSQALFTIAFAALHLPRDPERRCRARHRHRDRRPSDDLRHGRLRFQRRRVRDHDDFPDRLCDRQSLLRQGARRADVRPVRMALPHRGGAADRARACQQRTRRRHGTS